MFSQILKIGKSFEYYENGNKFAEYTINENEQIDGEYLGWSKSGYLEVKGFLVNGEKDGAWIERDSKGNYINGIKDGIWTHWYSFGEAYKEEIYEDGVLIEKKFL